jgi:hypothetical protein
VCFAIERDLQWSVTEYSVKLLTLYETDHRYEKLLSDTLKTNQLFIKLYVVISFVVYNIPNAVMVLQYLLTGKMELQTVIYLPHTDIKNRRDYLINLIIMSGLCEVFFFALMTYDILLFIYSFQVTVNVEILSLKIKELEKNLKEDADQEKVSVKLPVATPKLMKNFKAKNKIKHETKITKKLVEFIKEYEEYSGFVTIINKLQYPISFVSISVNAIWLCIGLFFMTKITFAIGFSGFVLYLFQLFIPCVTGTMVNIQVSLFD